MHSWPKEEWILIKRYDEEVAKSAFTTFLRVQKGQRNVGWENVPQESEPPDYYVIIGGMRYAVEITGIFDQVEVNGNRYSSIGISASLKRFVEELKTTAEKKGILTGGYAVALSPLSYFPQRREKLLLQLIDYIQRTQNMAYAEEEVIMTSGFEYVGIQKIDNQENYVEEIISYPPKWKSESIEELRSALRDRLQDKVYKLSKISEPVILLILDSFNYLDGRDWQDMVQQIEQSSRFHTICRIATPDKTFILTSNEQSWLST